MALITTENRNSVFKVGNSYLSVSVKANGEIRVAFDAPQEILILSGSAFLRKLKSYGWKTEYRSFYATHEKHGRLHLRDVERLIDGGDTIHASDLLRAKEMQYGRNRDCSKHDATCRDS